MKIPCALTIAGSDSGGGAGIQADLKTFAALGVHGMSAITSITAQNTAKVTAIQDIPAEIIREQIRVVVEDIGVDAIKTGMLHTSDIIEAVADELSSIDAPIVVDPVAVAKSGARLIREDAIETLLTKLIPLALVVTPNAAEAEALTGVKIKTLDDQKRAAKMLVDRGARAAVVKGGHLTGRNVVDVLYHAEKFYYFEAPRVDTKNTHGTGCVFASAIAAGLAKGLSVSEAVKEAKTFVTQAIRNGLAIGSGHGPVNPVAMVLQDARRYRTLLTMREALELITADPNIHLLVPESQMNLAMAIDGARGYDDVAAVPGRIVRIGNRVRAVSEPRFGASRHVASAILTIMKYSKSMRSAINIKKNDEILNAAIELGYSISSYDRRREPPEIKDVEGMTIPWGVEEAIKAYGGVPDVIYHDGDIGKEPMMLVIGSDAIDVARKVLRLAEKVSSGKG